MYNFIVNIVVNIAVNKKNATILLLAYTFS
jgi:hypothetical protein